MKIFKQGKWIWNERSIDKEDDYVTFIQDFSTQSNEVEMMISCDSVYAVYLNGKLVKLMECSDYPFDKFYDEIELNTQKGNNTLLIDVWHYGVDSQKYIAAQAGLIYEIIENGKIISSSSNKTPSRVMNEFKNGYHKVITKQQGDSFLYDFTAIKNEFANSVEVDKKCQFSKRDIHPILLLDRIDPIIKKIDNKHF